MNDNLPDIKEYKKYNYKLTPFKLCALQNFPFIEADFDAITNYQLIQCIKDSQLKVTSFIDKYVKELNNYIKDFENGIIKDFDCFKNCINKTIKDFENTIIERVNTQDRKVADAIQYMKDNFIETCNLLLKQMIEREELKVLLQYNSNSESLNLIVTNNGNSEKEDNNG